MTRIIALTALATFAAACGGTDSAEQTQDPPFTIGVEDVGDPEQGTSDDASERVAPQPPDPDEDVTGSEPDQDVTEPGPDEDATEPTPEDDVSEPTPEEDATEPTPEDDATEPTPEEDATEPTPEDDATEPTPEEDATEPTPEDDAAAPGPEDDAGPEEDIEEPCEPTCEGASCGDDGCGGSCGTCSDGDACNGLEVCDAGQCIAGEAVVCDDADACNGLETCDAGTGECIAGEAVVCDDADACNGLETCDAGTGECIAGEAVVCDDADACNGLETCDAGTGECIAGEAVVCDDADACNGLESCDAGTGECIAGEAVVCGDSDACNGLETCDAETGECIAGEAVVCDDADACNGVESCDAETGECLSGEALSCDDGDPCNGEESCVAETGCVNGAALACDDGVACNGAEYCEADIGCMAGTPPEGACDDGNACTADSCGLEGCEHTPGSEGESCDDGVACTGSDVCTAGVCSGLPDATACGDDDPCTQGSCDAEDGCVQAPVTGCSIAACASPVASLDGASCFEVSPLFDAGIPESLTIEFWLQREGADEAVLVDLKGDLGLQIRVGVDGTLTYVEEGEAGLTQVASLNPLALGTWRHIAVVRHADGQVHFFSDGAPEPVVTPDNTDALPVDLAVASLWVGCEDGAESFFLGALDELRVSAGVRYTEAFTPPGAPFAADEQTRLLLNFDDDADGVALDASPQGLNATWVGNDTRPTTSPVADCSLQPSCEDPPCLGAAWPSWELEDKQPGPAFGTVYGLDAFDAKVTVLALLSAS